MTWNNDLKRTAKSAFESCTGLRVTRARRPLPSSTEATLVRPPAGQVSASARPPARPETDRLLRAPVFVLSAPRSGSTLLRVLLNSHSQLHSPHETHFRRITVRFTTEPANQAMQAAGHNLADVEHILWDRLLHRELALSGKEFLVEKTPSNVFVWNRLATCWPDARFVFLIRHPYSIARSWHEGAPEARPMEEAVRHTREYMRTLEQARQHLPGHSIRYEDLTADPESATRALCERLGIPWEPTMTEYGRHDHGEFTKGIGDWTDKIKSGSVQAGRPLPEPGEIPEGLRPMAKAWGYLE
ncbi:sulfotransferase [Streptomyces sp. NBC_00243]|uniref:sulfotransferase family protein n=1 Tax=Streptomyces sp. NBC_00243 TaxID=2975688 RepID=UPI002DDC45E2|nr:sulfotransferase [Streptomyces sp. NBC_00243]WRZ20579.1 sulfotransferase [Streptomyces sp. NBC_00243]